MSDPTTTTVLQQSVVKIGGTEIGHGVTSIEVTKKVNRRPSLNNKNAPYGRKKITTKVVELQIECELDPTKAYPNTDVDSAVLHIDKGTATATEGVYFDGNCEFEDLKVNLNIDQEKPATLSFKATTVDGAFTWDHDGV